MEAMSSSVRRSSNPKPTRRSPFYRDLASPVSLHRPAGRYATPDHASSSSAIWRESLAGSSPAPAAPAASDLPPPPLFTLDDRAELSPEAGLGELPSPSPVSPAKARSSTPPSLTDQMGSLLPPLSPSPSSLIVRTGAEVDGSGAVSGRDNSSERSFWLSSLQVDTGRRDTDRGSPVDGAVEKGAFITLPPPPSMEVAKIQLQRHSMQNGVLNGDSWVTVFGFCPGDTNLVLRELEKCGTIVKHVSGPQDANWMHILYENPYDAQKALKKNGIQLNFLILGVKPVDPIHREFLTEIVNKFNSGGFIPLMTEASTSSTTATHPGFLARSNLPKASSTFTAGVWQHGAGSLASPSKSLVSKIIDLMFGI